jgi:hypothetical protein
MRTWLMAAVAVVLAAGIVAVYVFSSDRTAGETVISDEGRSAVEVASIETKAPKEFERHQTQDAEAAAELDEELPETDDDTEASPNAARVSPELSDEERAARLQRLREIQEMGPPGLQRPSYYGASSDNPFPRLDELDEDGLLDLLRLEKDERFSEATKVGFAIGEEQNPDDWITWFEDAGPSAGVRGQVTVTILSSAAFRTRLRKRHELDAGRLLALIDGYLKAWQGEPISTSARNLLTSMLERLAPAVGGPELIRKWLVETPHGDEIIEMGLYGALAHWPFSEVGTTAREALLTLRPGPIKGAIQSWRAIKRGRSQLLWTESDVKSLLPTLVESVKTTTHPQAILLAVALGGEELLKGYNIEIGWALLERTDSRACASMGFLFFAVEDPSLARSVWRDWFYSNDEYKVAVACTAAPEMRGEVIGEAERQRMQNLALDGTKGADLRASAAYALPKVETGFVRSRVVMQRWVVEPELEAIRLIALGRMATHGTPEVVEETLTSIISDTARTPDERHRALFLLAVRAPLTALAYCEEHAQSSPQLFRDDSVLLAAATVEAMRPETYQRTAAVRSELAIPEPQWIREIRLRLSAANERTEQRVVSYAWAVAPPR